MSLLKRIGILAVVLGSSVSIDQATKVIAQRALASRPGTSYLGDTFRLQYAQNKGAFLSLGAALPDTARFWVLTVSVGLLLVGILLFALLSTKLNGVQVAGYGFIGGGGLSNWIDRAMRNGEVVDFMNMGIGSLRTGVFNVADLAIIAGIILLVLEGWVRERREKQAKPAAPA